MRLDSDRRLRLSPCTCFVPGEPDRLLVVEKAGTIQLVDHGVASLFFDLKTAGLVDDEDPSARAGSALGRDRARLREHAPALRLLHSATDGALEVDEFTAAGDTVPLSSRRRVLLIPHPLGERERRPAAVRSRRDALRRHRRATTAMPGNGAGPRARCSARSCGSTRASGGRPYTIPPDNPFVGGGAAESGPTGCATRGASPSTAPTGDLLIGDVGEERARGGRLRPGAGGGPRDELRLGLPRGLIALRAARTLPGGRSSSRSSTTRTSRTRRHARSPAATSSATPSLGDLYGRYLYTDTCGGQIRSLVPSSPATDERSEGLDVDRPSSFGEDCCGRLYVDLAAQRRGFRFEGDARRLRGRGRRWRGRERGRARHPPRPLTVRSPARPTTDRRRSGATDQGLARRRRDRRRRPATRSTRARATTTSAPRAAATASTRRRPRPRGGADRIKGGPGKDQCCGGGGKDKTKSC